MPKRAQTYDLVYMFIIMSQQLSLQFNLTLQMNINIKMNETAQKWSKSVLFGPHICLVKNV